MSATKKVRSKSTTGSANNNNQAFLFDKSNYMLMIGGVLLILLGFVLMAGGKSPDPNQFNYDEIYSTTRVTVAPILILLGFALEVYAIMKKPAHAQQAEQQQ